MTESCLVTFRLTIFECMRSRPSTATSLTFLLFDVSTFSQSRSQLDIILVPSTRQKERRLIEASEVLLGFGGEWLHRTCMN